MKVGLYLAYAPSTKKYSLRQEGLGRYTSFVIKGLIENNHNVVIACPKFLVNSVYELIEDENIDKHSVEFVLPKAESIVFRIYCAIKNRKEKEKKVREYEAAQKMIDSFVTFLLQLKNIFSLMIICIFLFILCVLIVPIAIIFGVLSLLCFIIYKLLVFNKTTFKSKLKKLIEKICTKSNFVAFLNDLFEKQYNITRIQELVRLSMAKELVRRINTLRHPAEIWYSPTAFWSEFNHINGVRVTCIPDIVTTEFPLYFSKEKSAFITDRVRETIKKGKYFITYSDYVKREVLLRQMSKEDEAVISIWHAPNDMRKFIDVEDYFDKKGWKNATVYFARNIVLPTVLEKNINMKSYLLNGYNRFPIQDVKYIFYSSQVRGNKNILTLVKAYEYLLRNKNIQIKLFLTCDINKDKELKKYIYKKRLQYDVLCFYSVTNQQLAALYACAALSVNPTLYEGGFPFTFSESISVGTPSVMSNIPQVQEVLGRYENSDTFLFDSYDYLDIADKIKYGLENTAYLKELQQQIYNDLRQRDWKCVGKEYVEAFEYFVEKDKFSYEF